MEYLKTLGMSDLITYLELEPQSANFKKVERVLLSREKDMEKCKEKCSELSKALKENEVKTAKMEGMLVELSGYKALSEELREKVTRLEDDCKIISEKELNTAESFSRLLSDHKDLERTRMEENLRSNLQIADLECSRRRVEGEMEALRGECEQLENTRKHSKELEQKLQMSEDERSKLLKSLEEEKKKTVEMEDTVQELTKYRASCDELKEEVSLLEENCKMISEREKTAVQNVINLTSDLENLRRFRNEELVEFKTKYADLERAKQEAEVEIEGLKRRREALEKMTRNAKDLEKDLEKSKAHCCELSAALEEKSKKNLEMEDKLKEAQKYRATCEGLRKKVNCLEQSCKVSNENEKSANQKISELSGELEKVKKKKGEELNDLKTKNKDLEFAKQKVNMEINVKKKRCLELEKVVADLDKELKISMDKYSELLASHGEEKKKNLAMEGILEELTEYKKICICERLKETVASLEESSKIAKEKEKCANEKINKLTDDLQKLNADRIKEANELTRKNKDLECAKQKAEDQIEDQKKKYEETEKKMKHSINDLEKKLRMSKARCTELSTSLEGNSKKLAEEGKFEERKKYKMIYAELKEKITLLHNDCKIIKQRGRSVEKGIYNLLGDLVNFEPNEASAVKRDSLDLPTANVEVKTEVHKNERKKDENKQRKVQSKTNGGVTGAFPSSLKIKLKPPSCDGRASDSVHADALGQATPEVNSGEKVKVYSQKRKRKQTSELVCLNGEASQIQVDKLNIKHNKRIAAGAEHRSDYSGDKCLVPCGGEHAEESRYCSVSPCEENKGRNEGIPVESLVMSGTLIEKSGNLIVDDAKEKAEMDKRQVEKAEVDKRQVEKAEVDKRQVEKAEVDRRQVEKAEDKRQLERAEVDKRQLRRIIHPPVRLNL